MFCKNLEPQYVLVCIFPFWHYINFKACIAGGYRCVILLANILHILSSISTECQSILIGLNYQAQTHILPHDNFWVGWECKTYILIKMSKVTSIHFALIDDNDWHIWHLKIKILGLSISKITIVSDSVL